MKLPIETIQDYLRYSPEIGEFHWLKRSSDKTKVGSRAGRARGHGGYRQITLLGQTMYEHRLAWFCIHGDIPSGQTIDHINGDKGDNRLANLRIATLGENIANVGAKKDNTSGAIKWQKANPEYRAAAMAKRRAKAPDSESHTKDDIKELIAVQKGKCAICRCDFGSRFHVDHIVPLKLGGGNQRSNIQILCPPCNARKGAKHPVVFMQEMGYLI